MKRTVFPLLIAAFMAALCCCPEHAVAAAGFVLKGRILDAGGNPVEGGELFIYDSPRTRRAADFITPVTDRQGRYRIELPAGNYWVVARVRSGEKYGPLMSGGKHSGEAREIEATAAGEMTLDLTVADVREMARSRQKSEGEYLRVAGRILDRRGRPAPGAYAFARRDGNRAVVPDFSSPWSDEDGSYTLYLPAGRYCLGASRAFPPEEGASCSELYVDPGKIDIANDIRLNYIDSNDLDGTQSSGEAD